MLLRAAVQPESSTSNYLVLALSCRNLELYFSLFWQGRTITLYILLNFEKMYGSTSRKSTHGTKINLPDCSRKTPSCSVDAVCSYVSQRNGMIKATGRFSQLQNHCIIAEQRTASVVNIFHLFFTNSPVVNLPDLKLSAFV